MTVHRASRQRASLSPRRSRPRPPRRAALTVASRRSPARQRHVTPHAASRPPRSEAALPGPQPAAVAAPAVTAPAVARRLSLSPRRCAAVSRAPAPCSRRIAVQRRRAVCRARRPAEAAGRAPRGRGPRTRCVCGLSRLRGRGPRALYVWAEREFGPVHPVNFINF
jgi:hypothetical protein